MQINKIEFFPFYLECQNKLYEVDINRINTIKPTPCYSGIKNNAQLKDNEQPIQRNKFFNKKNNKMLYTR